MGCNLLSSYNTLGVMVVGEKSSLITDDMLNLTLVWSKLFKTQVTEIHDGVWL